MQVKNIISELELTVVAGQEHLDQTITGGYASDLLSNVMGQAQAGNVWVTMQGHQNIVAVASLSNLAAIIVAGGSEINDDTLQKAEKEGIALCKTNLSSFEAVGRLFKLGVQG